MEQRPILIIDGEIVRDAFAVNVAPKHGSLLWYEVSYTCSMVKFGVRFVTTRTVSAEEVTLSVRRSRRHVISVVRLEGAPDVVERQGISN